jgi:hypothetical protein
MIGRLQRRESIIKPQIQSAPVGIEQDCGIGFHEVCNDGHQEHAHERHADMKATNRLIHARRQCEIPSRDLPRGTSARG